MNKTSLTILIIVGVVIFLVGGGLGILYRTQNPSEKYQKLETAVATLSSKAVPSIAGYGQVTNIDGKNITLSYSEDSLTINISEKAVIYSFVASAPAKNGATSGTQKEVEFNAIKKGDYVNIGLKLSPDGTLQGETVIILPVFNAGNQ
jgi:flagellar basal body-associated protein FliL